MHCAWLLQARRVELCKADGQPSVRRAASHEGRIARALCLFRQLPARSALQDWTTMNCPPSTSTRFECRAVRTSGLGIESSVQSGHCTEKALQHCGRVLAQLAWMCMHAPHAPSDCTPELLLRRVCIAHDHGAAARVRLAQRLHRAAGLLHRAHAHQAAHAARLIALEQPHLLRSAPECSYRALQGGCLSRAGGAAARNWPRERRTRACGQALGLVTQGRQQAEHDCRDLLP